MPCYATMRHVDDIRRTFAYVFDPTTPAAAAGCRSSSCSPSSGRSASAGRKCSPCRSVHGTRPILGYRLGSFAYLTDCSRIPDESWPLLEGLDVLVLDALREKPHPTHFSLSEAIEATRRIAPRRAYFTHIVPRSLARDDVCATCRRGGAGL